MKTLTGPCKGTTGVRRSLDHQTAFRSGGSFSRRGDEAISRAGGARGPKRPRCVMLRCAALQPRFLSSNGAWVPAFAKVHIRRPRTTSIDASPQHQLAMCAAAARTVNLLVVTSKDAPELEVLKGLPDNVHIMATGRTMEELAHMEGQWDSVEAMLLCGLLKNFTTKDTLKELFSKVKNLKWMHVATAGVDHLLFPELVESDVALTNAQGAYSHSLAEYAITACNWFAKDLPRMRAAQKAKKWDVFDVEELRGSTMGVVGLGDIGSACARLGRAFKMNVVGLRRNVQMSEEEQREGLVDKIYPPEELCSLMSTSDYVVAALPMTPHTNKFINREAIQAMKPNGVFINVGRGKTVDEQALIEALQQNAIRGAGLDVFETEPLPEDSPLYTLDNVLMSAHCADRTAMFQHDSLGIFVDIAKQYVSTGELRNVVDKRSGY